MGILKEEGMIATLIGALKVGGALLLTPQGIGAGLAVLVLGYILKKIDNEWVYKPIYGVCYTAGVVCTVGLSKWKWTRGIWNKTIEPFVIDLLDNALSAVKNGLLDGLHSDNK